MFVNVSIAHQVVPAVPARDGLRHAAHLWSAEFCRHCVRVPHLQSADGATVRARVGRRTNGARRGRGTHQNPRHPLAFLAQSFVCSRSNATKLLFGWKIVCFCYNYNFFRNVQL